MGAILGVILLDETVVGVALPTIRAALHMSEVTAHWVVNVYAGLAAACGKLGDIVARKALMISGLAIFGAASAASGLADSAAWLIAARGIQGFGAAIIFPTSLAMATLVFPPEKRGLAIGIYGAIGTTFLALGPLVGGFLTDFASWRFVFFVNPPIVLAVALVVLAAWRDPPRAGAPQPLDKTGLLLLVGGLSMTVFALMQGPVWGWRDPAILSLLIAGLVSLTTFVFVELRKKAPLIAVRLFANPTFAGCNLVVFTAQYSKMAVFVFGALYLQDALKMSPFLAGLALLPTVAPQAALAPLAGRLADRYGARLPSILGVLGICVGLLAVGLAMARESYALMLPGLLLWGLALPFVFMPPQRAVMNAVPPQEEGEAGGIVKSSQQLGATIGVAVCSSFYLMTWCSWPPPPSLWRSLLSAGAPLNGRLPARHKFRSPARQAISIVSPPNRCIRALASPKMRINVDTVRRPPMQEDAPLSLRAALVENRLEDFVRAAEARGVEFSKGSEFERGLALLMVQRSRERRRHSAVSA